MEQVLGICHSDYHLYERQEMPNNGLLCGWTIIVFGTRLLAIYTPWELQEMPSHMPYPLGLGTRPQTVAQENELPKLLKRRPVPVWSVRECCFPADDSGGSHIVTLQWLMWFV